MPSSQVRVEKKITLIQQLKMRKQGNGKPSASSKNQSENQPYYLKSVAKQNRQTEKQSNQTVKQSGQMKRLQSASQLKNDNSKQNPNKPEDSTFFKLQAKDLHLQPKSRNEQFTWTATTEKLEYTKSLNSVNPLPMDSLQLPKQENLVFSPQKLLQSSLVLQQPFKSLDTPLDPGTNSQENEKVQSGNQKLEVNYQQYLEYQQSINQRSTFGNKKYSEQILDSKHFKQLEKNIQKIMKNLQKGNTTQEIPNNFNLDNSSSQTQDYNQSNESALMPKDQNKADSEIKLDEEALQNNFRKERSNTYLNPKLKQSIVSPDQLSSQKDEYFSVVQEEGDCSQIFDENVIKNSFDDRNKSIKIFLKEVITQTNQIQREVEEKLLAGKKNLEIQKNILLELNLRLANLSEVTPSLFQTNQHLRCVDLRNNRLATLPEQICKLPHLWKLKVDYNYLTEFPEEIGEIKNLEILTASQNRICFIPLSLCNSGNKLQVLQINDNQIQEIPQEIGSMANLKTLLLHNNYFTKIPSSMYQLQNLKEFSFDWYQYIDCNNNVSKIQKEESGKFFIEETLKFLSIFRESSQDIQDSQYVHFIHFLMFFQKITSISDINYLRYRPKSRSIFHLMSIYGHLYLLQELMQFKVFFDINYTDDEMSSPLILAMKNKRFKLVKYLLKLPQANLNVISRKYGHPLHIAIQSQEYKLTIKLLKASKLNKTIQVNAVNEDGNNALHYIFLQYYMNPTYSKQIAKLLIVKGIDLNQKNNFDMAPLHTVITHNSLDALNFILNHNQLIRQKLMENRKIKNKRKQVLFDFNQPGGKNSQGALHLAVLSNNVKLVQILLQSSEQLDCHMLDDMGRKPKELAPYNSPIYKMLLKYESIQRKAVYQEMQSSKAMNKSRDIQINQRNLNSVAINNGYSLNHHSDTIRPIKRIKSKMELSTPHSIYFEDFQKSYLKDENMLSYNSQTSKNVDQFKLNNESSESRLTEDLKLQAEYVEFKTPQLRRKLMSHQLLSFNKTILPNMKSQHITKNSFYEGKPSIKSDVSSPNASQSSIRFDKKNERDSSETRMNHFNTNAIKHKQYLSIQENSRTVLNKLPSQLNFDDENIAEEEQEAQDKYQERPTSQIRLLNKSFSLCNFEKQTSDEQQRLIKKIVKEINVEKAKINSNLDLNFMQSPFTITQTLATTQYLQTNVVFNTQHDLDHDDELGNLCQIQDDNLEGINQPNHKYFSTRLAATTTDGLSLFKQLHETKTRINYSKPYEQLLQLLQLIMKSKCSNQTQSQIDKFSFGLKFNHWDLQEMVLQVDISYLLQYIYSIAELKHIFLMSMQTNQVIKPSYTNKMKSLVMFEIFNGIQLQQVYDSNKKAFQTQPSFNKTYDGNIKKLTLNQVNSPNLKISLQQSPPVLKQIGNLQLIIDDNISQQTENYSFTTMSNEKLYSTHSQLETKRCDMFKLQQKWPLKLNNNQALNSHLLEQFQQDLILNLQKKEALQKAVANVYQQQLMSPKTQQVFSNTQHLNSSSKNSEFKTLPVNLKQSDSKKISYSSYNLSRISKMTKATQLSKSQRDKNVHTKGQNAQNINSNFFQANNINKDYYTQQNFFSKEDQHTPISHLTHSISNNFMQVQRNHDSTTTSSKTSTQNKKKEHNHSVTRKQVNALLNEKMKNHYQTLKKQKTNGLTTTKEKHKNLFAYPRKSNI